MASTSQPPPERPLSPSERFGSPAVWFAFLGGPLAWSAHFLASYGLVYVACVTGSKSLLYLVTVVAAAVAIAAAAVGWRLWRQPEPSGDPAAAQVGARTRFFGRAGLLMSVLFLLVILSEGAAALVFRACEAAP